MDGHLNTAIHKKYPDKTYILYKGLHGSQKLYMCVFSFSHLNRIMLWSAPDSEVLMWINVNYLSKYSQLLPRNALLLDFTKWRERETSHLYWLVSLWLTSTCHHTAVCTDAWLIIIHHPPRFISGYSYNPGRDESNFSKTLEDGADLGSSLPQRVYSTFVLYEDQRWGTCKKIQIGFKKAFRHKPAFAPRVKTSDDWNNLREMEPDAWWCSGVCVRVQRSQCGLDTVWCLTCMKRVMRGKHWTRRKDDNRANKSAEIRP